MPGGTPCPMVAATQFAVAAMRSRACHLHRSQPAEQPLAIQSSPFFRSADACRSGITRRTPLGSQVSRSEAGNHFRLAHLGKKPERPSACPLSGHGGRDRRRGAVRSSGRENTAPRPRAHGGLSRKIPSRAESGNPSRSTHDSQSDDGRPCAIAAESGVQSLLNRLGRLAWNVRIQQRYPHGVSVAGYLARYMTGGPISNRRIHSATQTEVTFWYRDHRDGAKKLMRLTPDEFLSRWFEHIPPRGLRMIRRSGLYANSCAKKRVEIQRQLLASTTNHSATKCDKKSLAAVFPLEPERCPVCNTAVVCRDTNIILEPHFVVRKWSIPVNQPP